MKLFIYSHPNKVDSEILNYYEISESNKEFHYLLQSPLRLKHLKGKRDSDIIDFILQRYKPDKQYQNIILFNEVLGVDCQLIQPLNLYILKTITDYIRKQGNYKNLLLNEYQIVSSYLKRKQSIKDLLEYLKIQHLGLQYHYKTSTSFIALPFLKMYLNYFTQRDYKVHLTETSIWEPNPYTQNTVFNSLYSIVKDDTESMTYWYLFDKDSNITPFKSSEQLPALCTILTDKLIKDYPYLFSWKIDNKLNVQEFRKIQNIDVKIDWDNYLIKKPIWDNYLCRMKS